ncbi:MAG: BamA/TamA family outer membrane protein [Pseudomonadota bacterium]
MRALQPSSSAAWRIVALAVSLTTWAGDAVAQTVSLTAPGASDNLVERLENNSLLLRAPEDEEDGTVRSGQDIVAAARTDYGRLIGVLYEEGYFAPVIEIRLDGRDAARISPFDAPATVNTVSITVQTGPEFRLGRAAIAPLARDTELPGDFEPGGPATTPLLRATTAAALEGWRNQGHAVADVAEQQIIARNREAMIDVSILLEPGPLVTFGELIPEGQQRMRPDRIVEIAGLPTGQQFTPQDLARAEERLRDTGVFSAISLTPRAPNPDNTLDVVALVDEAPLRRIGAGLEASTEAGFGVRAFWLHRNLLGGGERLRFDGAISGMGIGDDGIDFEISARLDRPATFNPDTKLSFELDAFITDDPTFDEVGIGGVVSLERRLTDSLSVDGGIGLSFTDIDDGFEDRTVTLLTLPAGLTYDTRDTPLDARSGLYARAEATPFLALGGTGGGRVTFDGRAYRAFGESARTRLAGRVQLGNVIGADIIDIPPDFLFFSGGAGTVRGQEFQSLGALQDGVETGGRSFGGLSGEIRHDIGDTNFGVVAFADAGLITPDEAFAGGAEFHAGTGLGIRYATPFGPIRVDIATPVSDEGFGSEFFLFIGIGQAF